MMSDQNGIFITKKQASIITASLILVGLLIFIAGYFWGKQSVIAGYSQKTSQESFNDQVDYLLTMQSFAAKHGALPEEQSQTEEDTAALLQNLPDALEEGGAPEEQVISTVPPKKEEPKNVVSMERAKPQNSSKDADVQGSYWATLAGFGKKASALTMVNRMKKYNIELEIKTKTSKSSSGKAQRSWYQVVTKKYPTKDDIDAVVDRIVSLEHLKRKDIKIYA